MFAQVNPNFYTSCKNDAEICSGSGGEADPCEGDTPDPETDYFCTADIPDGQDQKNHGSSVLMNVLMKLLVSLILLMNNLVKNSFLCTFQLNQENTILQRVAVLRHQCVNSPSK